MGDGELFPASSRFRSVKSGRRNPVFLVGLLLFFLWFFDPFSLFTKRHNGPEYPEPHPFGSLYTVSTTSKFIYPPIEDAPMLKELGLDRLFRVSRVRDTNVPEVENTVIESLNVLDDPDPSIQNGREEVENKVLERKVINAFKNHEKVVYRPKTKGDQPPVVIVTAVDFERYSLEYLTRVVQNRVNYAHAQGYGVYVRWTQEFAPIMNSKQFLTDQERTKWVRLYALRAAMFAFPEAKWFWYLDQDALVANELVDLVKYALNDQDLSVIALREQSVVPPYGLIKTYKTLHPENIRLIFTQSETKIETNSFIVKNDVVGRAIIDMWSGKLFLNYNNFPHGPDSAITHILQWHPFVLSKTALIPARMINSLHLVQELPEDTKSSDHVHYFKGDLVVQWSDAMSAEDAETVLKIYQPKDS